MKLINISCCFKFNKDTNLIKYYNLYFCNRTMLWAEHIQIQRKNAFKYKLATVPLSPLSANQALETSLFQNQVIN